MYALVEVHSEHEVEAALNAGAEIIGINNRNLETFRTDLSTTARLRPLVGTDPTIVTESGIATRRDMERLEQIGVDAALVGETIMRSADVAAKARELLGDSR
jgi:indole-3-glycerol phosphate synthase